MVIILNVSNVSKPVLHKQKILCREVDDQGRQTGAKGF